MADSYDPYVGEDEDQREQSAYDQEEAARAQLLDAREPPQTFTGYGEPVAPPPEQAIPTAPQAQPAQQPPAQQQPQYARIGETFTADNFQPQQAQSQQPQQRGAPLAPYPQVTPTANRKEQADADYKRRFGPIISDEKYDVRPELATQPTGGFATVVGLDISTMGHQMSSLAGIALKQLGASTEYLDHVNEQWQKFNEGLTASLDPSRQAAAGVSVFDPKHLLEVAGKNPGAVLESYLVTGATAVAGGLGAGAATKLAARTAARLAGVALETTTAAGEVTGLTTAGRVAEGAGIAGAGVQGGAAGAGARYEDYVHTLNNMTPEEKANSAMYQSFKAKGLDDAAIIKQMELQFPTLQQFGANLIASTGLAAVTPGLRGAVGQQATRLGNVAVGAAEAGGAGAIGGGYSSYTQQRSNVAAGAQPAINWGRVGAETAVGAGMGLTFGAGAGAFRGGRPAEPPPLDLTTPAPARVDNVTPSGVPPEHTAALNAAGIGKPPPSGPGGTALPPEPTRITPGAFDPGPPRQGPPMRAAGGEGIGGTALPPEPVPRPPDPRYPPGMSPGGAPLGPEPTPAPFARPQPVGPGGTPLRAEPSLAEAIPTRPVAPAAGPGGASLPSEPYRAAPIQRGEPPPGAGPGGTLMGPEPYPASVPPRPQPPAGAGPGGTPLPAEATPATMARAATVGPGGAPLPVEPTPAPAPPRPAPPSPGPGGAPLPAEPVRRVPRREQGPGESPGGTPLPEQQQRAAAPRQLEQAVRGEGFTTQPGRAVPRVSEGLNADQLREQLAARGLTKRAIARLGVDKEKLGAALDKIDQEARDRGEPAPTPRGAEAREPAPAARPSEGMSHKALGEALEKLGLSKREINQLTNKAQRAAEYDRIRQSEDASMERLRNKPSEERPAGDVSEEAPPREQAANATARGNEGGTEKAAPAEPAPPPRAEAKAPAEPIATPKVEAVKARGRRAKREAAATARAEEVAATPEDTPPTIAHELPATQASRDQRNQPTAAQSPISRVMQDDRVNAPVRAAIDAGGSLHDGLRAIANNPYINKRLPHVAAYARSLLKLAPDLQLTQSTRNRRGAYVDEGGVRRIEVNEKSAEVLLHEGTHAVTDRLMRNLEPGSKETQVLQTIRDEFARGAEAQGRLGDEQVAYALSNPHELHAMLRTNPEMHDLMRGIVPGHEYRARMAQLGYSVGPAKSLWQSFVRFIRQALHLPQNVTSLMDHVMRPLDDITRAGARFNEEPRAGYRAEPSAARTEHELPSFSDVRDATRDTFDPSGRLGNVLSGARRAFRQTAPLEQLIGFNRHLFNPSSGGRNLLDTLKEAGERVQSRAEEYGKELVNKVPRDTLVNQAIKKLDVDTNTALLNSTVVDTNPGYPRDHPLNSQSRADKTQFETLQKEYNALTDAQKKVYQDTFAMKRQERANESDAAMRGIGKAYLDGVDDAQLETLVRQMRTEEGINQILNQADTNPVAKAFGEAWVTNRELVNALARERKRGWINNYVPTARSGDWALTYTEPPTLANGRPNPASGELGYATRATIREAEQLRQELSARGAEPSLVLSKEKITPQNIPRLELIDRFEDRLQSKLANASGAMMTPEQLVRERAAGRIFNQDEINAARDLLTKVILDSSRFAGSMRERLGVHGADPTKLPEVMAQNFMAHKNRMGTLEYGPQVEAALGAMQRHVRELGSDAKTVRIDGRDPTNADAIRAQQVLEEARRRRPTSDDPQNMLTRGAQNAVMFTYFKFLASPAMTIRNGVETYVGVGLRIAATMGVGRATTALARASAEIMPRQFARGVAGTGAAARGRLDPAEWNSAAQIVQRLVEGSRKNDAAGITALYKRMTDGNLIGYSSFRDLQNMAKGSSGRIRNATNMAADFVSILNNKMEDGFRATAALAAYDAYTQKHGFGDRGAAIDYADKIMRASFPNYNMPNKPRISTAQGGLGAWGIPITQFRQQGMFAYWQFSLDVRNAFKGANKDIRKEAAYAALFTAATQTIMFGTLNYLADPMRYIWGLYDALSGEKPTNHSYALRQAAAHVLGPVGGQLFSHGLSAGLGYGPNVSNSLGMANILGVPEFQGDYKNPRDVTSTALMALAGAPAVSAGSEVFTGFVNFAQGNIRQAVQDLLPKVVRDPLKAYQGETEGIVTRRGKMLETPEQVTALDTLYRALGFESARQGDIREGRESERQFTTQVAASRHEATKAAADVMATGSASEKHTAAQMIEAHNRQYPFNPIKYSDVANYRKEQLQRLKDPTLGGLTVSKASRAAVRQQGAFANY